MITVETLKTIEGYQLTDSGLYLRAPWDRSPDYPLAAEQAPVISVVRNGATRVDLSWSPSSGLTPKCWRQIKVSVDASVCINHVLIGWGDGSSERHEAYGLPTIELRPSHTYTATPSSSFTVQAYDAAGSLVDSYSGPASWDLSADWYVQLYRVEKFRGDVLYSLVAGRWLLDWTPYTGAAGELSFSDYDASNKWNWGYRLWLREVDDQGRPGLTMALPGWSETGAGEGAGREAP